MNFIRHLNRHQQFKTWALLTILFLTFNTASAQDEKASLGAVKPIQTYDVGGTSIVIPPPAKDMVVYSNSKGRAESFVPPYNRFIAAFVPTDDQDKVVAVDTKAPTRLALVQVSRQFESTKISESDFRTIIGSVAKGFNSTVDSYAKENEEEFNRRLKALDLDSAKITFEKPISLGILFYNPNTAAFGTIIQVSAGSASIKKVLSVAYTRVKDRVIFSYFFEDYKDQDTAMELRKTSEAWAEAILDANK